jgi:DnaJ-class molecular chaperone
MDAREEGKLFKDIGDAFGVSPQYAREVYARAQKKLSVGKACFTCDGAGVVRCETCTGARGVGPHQHTCPDCNGQASYTATARARGAL